MTLNDRHAYLIIAHNEPEVLQTLLSCLDYSGNDIYLHIDVKSTRMNERFASWQPKYANYYLQKHPLHIGWGGDNMIRAELMLLTNAHANGPYVRYHILSGTCLPLKPQHFIHAFFRKHPNREYISFWDTPQHLVDLRRKVRYYYFFNEYLKNKNTWEHRLTTPIRKLALIIQKLCLVERNSRKTYKKGSLWSSITEEACTYLVENSKKIIQEYKRMLCADEIFIQTELWNSAFQKHIQLTGSIEEESLRLINWEKGSPYTWRSEDLDELSNTSALFARKFNSRDKELLQRIMILTAEKPE